jgi:hypothetical protein
MVNLCSYRNALGVPRRGVHRQRMLGNLAMMDVALTVIASLLLSFFFFSPFQYFVYFIKIFVIVFLTLVGLGILLHRLYCVRTTIDIWLFPQL